MGDELNTVDIAREVKLALDDLLLQQGESGRGRGNIFWSWELPSSGLRAILSGADGTNTKQYVALDFFSIQPQVLVPPNKIQDLIAEVLGVFQRETAGYTGEVLVGYQSRQLLDVAITDGADKIAAAYQILEGLEKSRH